MKILKKVFCFMLCVISVTLLSACGKTKNEDEQVPKDPNQDYENEMTLQEVFGAVYNLLDNSTKTEFENTLSFSSKNSNEVYNYELYDQFAYASIYVLKVLSETDDLVLNTWITSNETSQQLSQGDASKLEMLYISREKQDYQNNIKAYMLFSKQGYNLEENPNYFTFFAYEIAYNEQSNKLQVSCYNENSRQNSNRADSNATYNMLSFDSDLKMLQVATFVRLQDFDYKTSSNLIATYITSYNYISFYYKENTVIAPSEDLDISLTSNLNARQTVQSILCNFENFENLIFNIEGEQTLVNGLTDKFVKIANASKISDFAS